MIRGPDISVLAKPLSAFDEGFTKTEISGPLIIKSLLHRLSQWISSYFNSIFEFQF